MVQARQSEWSRNVSEYPSEPPSAVYAAHRIEDVVELIESRPAEAPKLRSTSTGRNWGLGSASWADQETAVIDLSGMDKIRHLNTELGFAILEPGVTQAALSEALLETSWFLNCTASSADTSVLGNMMDRGVGIRHQRTLDLLGLEVVLGDGQIGTIGWWPGSRGEAPNRLGLGPSLLHVFTQANFGVATAAVVQLQPRPESHEVLTTVIEDSRFWDLLTEIRAMTRQGLLSGVTKVYDPVSTDLYGGRTSTVTTHMGIEGTLDVARAKRTEVVARLRRIGATVEEPERISNDPLAGAVVDLYQGDVSRSEDIIESALGVSTPRADQEGKGWIFSLPFIPFTPDDVMRARQIVADVAHGSGLSIGTTTNVLAHNVVDLVIAIRFARSRQSAAARKALDSLTLRLTQAGYQPYRLDTTRTRSDVTGTGDLEADLIGQLHQVLDPGGVFAPSRYTK